LEQFDEVDARRQELCRSGWFPGRRVAVDNRIDGPRRGLKFSLKPDLDLRCIERIEVHLDGVCG